LKDRIMLVRSALDIANRHSPILLEGSTKGAVISDLNDHETKNDVGQKIPHQSLVLGKSPAVH
jgi:hypothetical protein